MSTLKTISFGNFTSDLPSKLQDLLDVDLNGAIDGSVLQYDETLNKWQAGQAVTPSVDSGHVYGTTLDLANDESLVLGDICQTAGFETVGDCGGSTYVIEDSPYIWGAVTLKNGLYANLVDHVNVSAIALGCKPGDGFDNGTILNAIAEIKRQHENIYTAPLIIHFPAGEFVMSPVLFDCPGIFIEGNIEPGEAWVPQTGGTTFAPAGDQEYIIQFGRDATNLYGPYGDWMYQSGGMRNIRFCCEKWNDRGGGTAHHFQITKACLVLGRRCYNWFDRLMFRDIWGSCIYISASYELVFGRVYMYHIFAPENGALHFGYDIGNSRENKISDNSALFFDYLAMEAIVGDPIQFAGLNDTYNTMFNVIDYEDYRLDNGDDPENSWGCPWTDTTWLPDGYTEPDVELGIFHFKEHCTMDNCTVNTLNLQFISHRSYTLESDGLVYARDGIVLVDPDVFTWSLSIGTVDIHASARGPIKPVISKSPYLGRLAHLHIGNLTTNDAGPDIYPDGYLRDYDVRLGRLNKSNNNSRTIVSNPTAPAYESVYDYTVVTRDAVTWAEMESLNAPSSAWDSGWVGRYQPLGKGLKGAYSWNSVCAITPSRTLFPDQSADTSPIRIPITNDILYLRIKEQAEDSVVGAVNSLADNSRLLNFNLRDFPGTDWKWVKLDLSAYKHTGYVTFYTRAEMDAEALLDVFYWEQKVPEIPDIPEVYYDKKVLQKVDIFSNASSATETINGITFTFDKDAGTVTLSGTATANASYRLDITVPGDGVFYASANVTPEGSKTTYRMLVYDSTTWVQPRDSQGNQFQSICANEVNEFVKEAGHGLFLSFYVNNGVTIENAVFTPVIFKSVGTIDNRGSYDGTTGLDVYDWIPEVPEILNDKRVLKDKDILSGLDAIDQTVNGITFTLNPETGVVTLTGTATANASLTVPLGSFKGGTYYASANVTPNGSTTTYRMLLRDTTAGVQPRDSKGNQFQSICADEINEFVMPDGNELSMVFYVNNGTVIESATFTPIIYEVAGTIKNIGSADGEALDVYDWVPEDTSSETPIVRYDSKVLEAIDGVKTLASTSGTDNGITYTYDNATGIVSIEGTATASSYWGLTITGLESGVYYASANVTPNGSTTTYRLMVYDTVEWKQARDTKNNAFKSLVANETNEFVLPEGHTDITLLFHVDNGITVEHAEFTPVVYRTVGTIENRGSIDGETNLDVYDWIPKVPSFPDTKKALNVIDVLSNFESTSHTDNGITFTLDKAAGTISLTGTATANASYVLDIGTLDEGTYYISADVTPNGSTSTYRMMVRDTVTGVQVRDIDGNAFKSICADELNNFVTVSGHPTALVFFVDSGVTVESATFKPTLYKVAGTIDKLKTENNVELDVYDFEIGSGSNSDSDPTVVMGDKKVLRKVDTFTNAESTTATNDGITYTFDKSTGVVTISGTATASSNFGIALDGIEPGTYYTSANVTPNGSSTTYRMMIWDNTDSRQVRDTKDAAFKSLVADETNEFVFPAEHSVSLMFHVDNGVTVDSATFTPEIFEIVGTIDSRGSIDGETELTVYDWIQEPEEINYNRKVLKKVYAFNNVESATYENHGVTYVFDKDAGTVTATGTATDSASNYSIGIGIFDPGVYYAAAHITPSGSMETYRMMVYDLTTGVQLRDTDGNAFRSICADETNDFVIPDRHGVNLVFHVDQGVTVDGVVFTPEIFAVAGTIENRETYTGRNDIDVYDWIPDKTYNDRTVLKQIDALSGVESTTSVSAEVNYTYDAETGVVTADGTATGSNANFGIPLGVLEAGTYYASASVSPNGNISTYRMLVHDDKTNSMAHDSNGNLFKSITAYEINEFVAEGDRSYTLMFHVTEGATATNATFKPVIYKVVGTIDNVGSFDGTTGLDIYDWIPEMPEVTTAVPLESTTWSELKAKRDAGTLSPGTQYRITDYVCTTLQEESRAVSHPFDVIVTADSENTLNENARACLHEGDNYYSAEGSSANLDAWELKYCLDNDVNRFKWADEADGRGVIYWLKDDKNNECPYDFKQIQFKRYKITACEKSPSLVGFYAIKDHSEDITIDENDFIWAYTFSLTDPESETITVTGDASIVFETAENQYGIHYNTIKEHNQPVDPDEWVGHDIIYLNDIVFFGGSCTSNTFGDNCYSNTFGNDCYSNTFGNECSYNTFGNSCNSNTFGNGCYNNTFGDGCYFNTFDDGCYNNTFGGCYNNTFGNYCYSNTFGNNCDSNIFGDNYQSNTFGDRCSYNTFGNNCDFNTFGNRCMSNTFGKNCSYISIPNTTKNNIQYYNFLSGVKGTAQAQYTPTVTVNNEFVTYIGKDSNGEIKTWVLADTADKQDKLTFDSAPTANSTNPVTSGGVYTAIEEAKESVGTPLESITWSELKAKRDGGTLKAGAQYRITDYICTTTQEESQAVSHPFDIIVTADSANTLNENARACLHDGDNYYSAATSGAKLEQWELKYCLDNDTNRFKWADTTNGRGVIYYLKDEKNNECPYDFKQIQFKRYKITACEKVLNLVGFYAAKEHAEDITIDENDFIWAYTFSAIDPESETFSVTGDASIIFETAENNYYIHYNTIKEHNQPVDPDEWIGNSIIYLSDIVFFGNNCYSNTFGNNCYYNTFGNNCYSNTFGNNCYSNTFGNACQFSTFGNYCYFSTFGYDCSYNTFGDGCDNNTFGDSCYSNTFGNNCYSNTFGDVCNSNTFGYDCNSNTFGNNCSSNTFGDRCNYISIPNTTNNIIQYYNILSGVSGTDQSQYTPTVTANNAFITYIGKDSSGNIVQWVGAEMQSKLTFDSAPTSGSSNPVTSGGVYAAIQGKQDALTFDTIPTTGSTNPVTSGGIKAAIDSVTSGGLLYVKDSSGDGYSGAVIEGNVAENTATANYAHAEGTGSHATGQAAHSEGRSTQASGTGSHAEGVSSNASAWAAHAEGSGTHAYAANQHVVGKYNVDDSAGTYVEIVGNGSNDSNRSNARTLDWSGNERLVGSLTLGAGTSDETSLTATELKNLKSGSGASGSGSLPSKTVTLEKCPKVFASSAAAIYTTNGITFEKDLNGVVTVSGTATDTAHYFVDMATLKAGTYSIRCNVTPAGSKSTYRLLIWDTSTGHQVLAPSGSGFSSVVADELSDFVIPAMHDGRYQLYFRVDSGVTVDNATFTPEIFQKHGDYTHQVDTENDTMYDFYDDSVSEKAITNLKWNAVGDSITHNARYINYIQKTLGLNCTNLGVASSTIAVNSSNTDLQNGSIAERILGLNGNTSYDDADVWTVFGGVNDVIYGSQLGSLAATGTTFDTTTVYGALQAIVENILGRRNHPRLLLITPTHSIHDNASNGGATAAQVVKAFEDVGEYYGVPVVNMFKLGGLNAFINQHATYPATFDGLHPNQNGGAMIAAPIIFYLKMLLYDYLD